jgi:hypothetical protein
MREKQPKVPPNPRGAEHVGLKFAAIGTGEHLHGGSHTNSRMLQRILVGFLSRITAPFADSFEAIRKRPAAMNAGVLLPALHIDVTLNWAAHTTFSWANNHLPIGIRPAKPVTGK